MDRDGIDFQVLSPTPQQFFYELPPEAGRAANRMVNDYLAQQAARMPERFVALGTVPLQQIEFACAELDRCCRELGMRGVEISTNVNGEDLSSDRLAPFFARAEELAMLTFLHPMPKPERRLSKFYLHSLIANPLESTIAVSHLIMGGVLDRHPGLKVCVAHGGGFLPTYTGRMDHAFKVRADCRHHLKHTPSHYLKRLYFDTVVFDGEHVRDLVRRYGADHVVMGTDYAYDMEIPDPVAFISGMTELSSDEKRQILSTNAEKLLYG
jgi:aminocarboxymuconate-semialdehyde decarboxylase